MFSKRLLVGLGWSLVSLLLKAQSPFYDSERKLWGYKTGRDKIIIPAQFEAPYPYSKVLKKIALPAQFEKISFDSVNRIFIAQAKEVHLYTSEGNKIEHPSSTNYKALKPNYYTLKTSQGWSIFRLKSPQKLNQYSTICPLVKNNSFIIKMGDYYRALDSTGQFMDEKRYRTSAVNKFYAKYLLQPTSKSHTLTYYVDTIFELAAQVFAVGLEMGYRLIKIETAKIKTLDIYDSVKTLNPTLIGIKRNGLWGALNLKGDTIIPIAYPKIESHNKRYIEVVDEAAHCRIFDLKRGEWFASQQYIIRPEGNLFLARHNNLYGYLDTTGSWAIPPEYTYLSSPIANWITAKKDAYFGIINTQNQTEVSFLYDSLLLINEHYLVYFENSEWGTYNRSNFELARHNAAFQILPNGCLKLDSSGRQGFVNYFGILALPTQYDSLAEELKGGLLPIYQNQNTTYMDLSKTALPPPKYQVLNLQHEFSDGYIPARASNALWGFIDYQGFWRISNRYDSLRPFSEGYAPFKLKGSWGYLNYREQIQIQPIYQSVSEVEKKIAIVKKDGYYGLLNLETKSYLVPLRYAKITLNSSGNYILVRGGKLGWVRLETQMNNLKISRIYPKYSDIIELSEDFLRVGDKGSWGVDGVDGRSIFLPRYKSILYFKASKYFVLLKD